MSEKKHFSKRTSQGERRSNRNSLKDVKDFVSSSNTVGRNSELEQSKNTRERVSNTYSMATGQYRLPDPAKTVSGDPVRDEGCNLTFDNGKSNTVIDESRNVVNSTSEPALKSSQRIRHLPLKAISPATIANISKKIGKLREEMINFEQGSTSAIPKSDSSPSKKAQVKSKPNMIVMPKEHMKVLQQRIKSEIENLKKIEGTDIQKLKEQDSAVEFSEDLDLEDLGSDIQFLSAEKRDELFRKFSEIKSDEELKSVKEKDSETLHTKGPVITIDLTKESTPIHTTEKTEMNVDSDYPSLDLDYGSKINWDDGEKVQGTKHSVKISDKPTVNLDIDETKLTVETSKKITDIKNRLSRSLSIGLSHKEAEKELSSELKEKSKLNIPGAEEENECATEDAETLELASLRCTSERTEVIADRERRRKRRCADYPGLAFGFSIFSSDTMMKFNIIRNELHNIMNTQLKRVGIGLNFFALIIFKLL